MGRGFPICDVHYCPRMMHQIPAPLDGATRRLTSAAVSIMLVHVCSPNHWKAGAISISDNMHISPETVVSGLRSLSNCSFSRTGRTRLMGLMLLKAKEPSAGTEFELHSSGPGSVEPQLRRFFRVAPGTRMPDVNPFGTYNGRTEYLAPQYERRGTYTQLYPGRALEPLFEVSKSGKRVSIVIPPDTSRVVAEDLGAQAPLRATAAFLLRNEDFDADATDDDLIARFTTVFKLSDSDVTALFEDDRYFVVNFSEEQFANELASLPSDFQPRATVMSHASEKAAEDLVKLDATGNTDLVIDDHVQRRICRAVATSKAVALVGLPGTAKSALWANVFESAADDPSVIGLKNSPRYVCCTAEMDWTARTLVGGYYPNRDGELVFREGYLLQAIRNNQILWIDEMNRADLDRILGPVLTFLAGQSVDLGPTNLNDSNDSCAPKSMVLVSSGDADSGVIEDEKQRIYFAGSDWRIVGTYNNVDRGRVFAMGSALTRRWAMVPVPPIDPEDFEDLLMQVTPREPIVAQLKAAYELHLDYLPIGPAPFLDMARYVSAEDASSAMPHITDSEHVLLQDAYVLYLGQQLVRLDPDRREGFFGALGKILGDDLASEADSY